jgi:hypothetical protein
MGKVERTLGANLVVLERIIASGGGEDFFTARAYEKQINLSDHQNVIQVDKDFLGDIAYRSDAKGSKEERNHKEVYRLVDVLFPELLNKGTKSEGYVRYSLSDIKKSPFLSELRP